MRDASRWGVKSSTVADNDATVRIRAPWAGKTAITADQATELPRRAPGRRITPAESEELRRLYAELPVISAVAAEALGEGDHTGVTSTRFRELDDRVCAISKRINEILG